MAEGTVAILGLGLMGGSLARDLAGLGHRVLGWDRDAASARGALAEGCIHGVLGSASPGGGSRPDTFGGVEEADVVVLALPVAASRETLTALAPRLQASLVTDVGSTKRGIVAAAEAAGLADRFVGSHPLAGDHRSGWKASRPGLFRGVPCFLCPARGASDATVDRAAALWRSVGAMPQPISAGEHDARMAWVSHLPQAAASALAAALAGSPYGPDALGPGGRDATRLAASSTDMWTDILLENADEMEPALEALEGSLTRLRAALGRGNRRELERLLAEAKAWKERDPRPDPGRAGGGG